STPASQTSRWNPGSESMCSAERTLLRQRHHGMSLSGMPPMVDERRPRREVFSEPCTVVDRTFPPSTPGTCPRNSPRRHRASTKRHRRVGGVRESCGAMTGRRPIRSSVLSRLLPRRVRAGAPATGALALCAALVAGCGVVPGATGASGDDPITVMTWAPERTGATDKPGMPAFARAYARWVNERGGLDGRPLRVLTCNERNDSVTAARCARRAVEEDAVAVVGSYSQHTDALLTTLEGAGIPYIGGDGLTDDEFTSPLSYPVNGGLPTLLAGLGRTLADRCGPVALVRPDTIAGDRLPALLDSGLRAGGHAPTEDRRAPEDATSYGDEVRHALEGATAGTGRPGCVVPALGDGTRTFMDSFRRARRAFPEVRTGTVLGSVDQSTVDASGGASGPYEGSFVTGWYPHAGDARWAPLREVVEEAAFGDNRIDPGDAGVQTTWIA